MRLLPAGNLLYLSGHAPKLPEGAFTAGNVGQDVSVEEEHAHASLAGLSLPRSTKAALGELSRIDAVV